MRTSIVLNPKYDFLKDYIEQVPERFEALTDVLYNVRNVIKTDEIDGLRLVIKSYHRIYLTNRIRYTFFHPSKAKRAFNHGIRLIQNGFLTPDPVAYIESYEYGLLSRSFFICLFTDFTLLSSHLANNEPGLMKDLAKFTFDLHHHGIYHMDYSNGNILCKKENGHFKFSLIDNNRMKFGVFSYSRRLKNFRLLGLTEGQLTEVAKEYSRLEKRDEKEAAELLVRYVRRHTQRRQLKKNAKRLVRNKGKK
jgi:hypothetical protein